MVSKSTLLELANKSIGEHRAKVKEWADANGVEAPKLAEAPLTAEGTLEFGGLFGTAVLLQLTFDTGEKRTFHGTVSRA